VSAIMQAGSSMQHIWIRKEQSAVHTICKAGVRLESHSRPSITSRFSHLRPLIRTNQVLPQGKQSGEYPSSCLDVACQSAQSSSILDCSRTDNSASTLSDPAARKTPSKICSPNEHALGSLVPRPLLALAPHHLKRRRKQGISCPSDVKCDRQRTDASGTRLSSHWSNGSHTTILSLV
jgi:hypothetical protein